jgi:hypothetical protein
MIGSWLSEEAFRDYDFKIVVIKKIYVERVGCRLEKRTYGGS